MRKFLIAAALVTMAASPLTAYAEDHHGPHGDYVVNGRHFDRAQGPHWDPPHGYQAQHWAKGGRLPPEYRRTVVRDYRTYHLAPPPRGYQYVRVGNDVILTAVATGVIASVIANAFY